MAGDHQLKQMNIIEQKQGEVTVLKLDGALIEPHVPTFTLSLGKATANAGRCVVDLSSVPFVDDKGFDALLDATEVLSRNGRALKLCGVSKPVRQVMEQTALMSYFDHFEDVKAAVKSFV